MLDHMTGRQIDIECIHNLHKSIYGFHIDFYAELYSDSQLQDYIKELSIISKRTSYDDDEDI